MKAEKPIYYPDGFKFDKERLIFARFDGATGTALNVPIFFSNNDVLTDKIILGIDVMLRGKVPGAAANIQTDLGFIGTTMSSTSLRFFTITLIGKNGAVILNDMPLYNFNVLANDGKIRRLNCMIDLSKSYIRNFGAVIPSTTVIPINFYFKNR